MPISRIKETFKKRPELPDAIMELRPNNAFSISLSAGSPTAPGQAVYDWQSLVWDEQNTDTPPTYEESQAKLVELEAEWQKEEYARNRFFDYPKIEEQLAMLYDDIKSGVPLAEGSWFNSINEVKETYPKP